jgi:hypothetical protein
MAEISTGKKPGKGTGRNARSVTGKTLGDMR